MPNWESKQDRKNLVDKAYTVLKDVLVLPEESRKSIYEEFDPVLLTTECFEKWMYKAFDEILDYDGDNLGFIKLMKDRSAELIVNVISEIEEGFIEGINDVLIFARMCCTNLLMAAAPPAQAATAKGIAIPCIMKFIEKSWNGRPKTEAPVVVQTPVAEPQPTPAAPIQQAPEELKEGESVSITEYIASA